MSLSLRSADDGTVIGLTRSEMDASLRTLELMASEVGATVLVLKEIVLIGSTLSPGTSLSSSAVSLSSASSPSLGNAWKISRPDLSKGNPRPTKLRRSRRRDLWTSEGRGESSKEKQVIFDHAELEARDTDSDDSSRRRSSASATDEDVPPFHLDLEESAPPSPAGPGAPWRWQPRPTVLPRFSEAELADREKKAEMKRLKSAARREERRLDLLRGDGKSPVFLPENISPAPIPVIQHQPARPSSLRLATPASPDDGFLNDLPHFPLDSLSLSFADVRTVTSDHAPSLSTSAETVYAIPMSGEDMICVEALVVRKAGYGEEEGWGFGGQEDGWGFGGEGEVDEYG